MIPDISEFSYGFALVNELVTKNKLTGAPDFPTQNEEGRIGGYDVRLPRAGVPVFLQVKRSECLVRRSAAQAGELGVPHYRMHLRPLRHSLQHNLLRDLEATEPAVFYVTPRFHKHHELDDAYRQAEVVKRSTFIKPSAVGQLPDDGDHYLAISADGSTWLLCSKEPRKIHSTLSEAALGALRELTRTRSQLIDGEYLRGLGDSILERYVKSVVQDGVAISASLEGGEGISGGSSGAPIDAKERERVVRLKADEVRRQSRPIAYAREVAHTLLGCELLFATGPD